MGAQGLRKASTIAMFNANEEKYCVDLISLLFSVLDHQNVYVCISITMCNKFFKLQTMYYLLVLKHLK